ncbi:MAG: HEPN domain-containing protein [Limosilactobacillus reuteri]
MKNKISDMNMFQNFKVKACWFLNDNQNSGSYGLLKYNAGQESVVEISPAFCDETEQFNSPSPYDICGISEYGEIIRGTGYRVGSSFNHPGLSIEKIQFFDFSVDNFRDDSFSPKLVNFSATDFNYWFPNQKFSIPDKGLGVIIETTKATEIGKIKYDNVDYILKIGYASSSEPQNYNHNFNIRMNTFLMLEADQALAENKTLQLIQKIIEMYEIIAEPASLKDVCYIEENKKRKLFLNPKYKNFLDNKYSPNLFFLDYNDVQSELLNVINNWVSSSKELQLLVDDYLLTVNYRSVIENDLVNYTQGIESYFRNERLTLRDKINKFIEGLPESYRELLSEHVGNTDDWIEKLVDTRVFLTHGDRENMAVSNPYKLVQMTKIFGFMVRIFILQKLGITIDKPKILNKFKNVLTTHYY